MKKVLTILIILAVSIASFSLSACQAKTPPLEEVFLPWLRVEGTTIVDEFESEILLEGVNAGGLFLTEGWMTLLATDSTIRNSILGGSKAWMQSEEAQRILEFHSLRDNVPVHQIFLERFGAEQTREIWAHYRSHFWQEIDFANIAEMGMNVIRLPFFHYTVDPDFYMVERIEGQRFNFTLLDEFVASAARHGLYTILDLHGTYGSHNGQDHSGQTINPLEGASVMDFVTFWDPDCPVGTENRRKTVELWSALAEHIHDNPNIAGLYLLNEPGEKAGLTSLIHWNFFDEMYRAIREVNQRHIVMFNPTWGANDIPHPTNNPYGFNWDTNVVYAFHHYTHYGNNNTYQLHMQSMLNRVNEVDNANFGVPIIMGEFTVLHAGEQGWISTLRLFQERGWSWTSWTYKINQSATWTNSVWGVYNSRAVIEHGFSALVNPAVDSAEQIKEKWARTATDSVYSFRVTFPSGNSLFSIMQYVIFGKL